MHYFQEKQRLNQWWVWLGMLSAVAIIIYSIVKDGWDGMTIGFGAIPMVLAIALIASIQLKSEINEQGITAQLFPILLRKRHFAWEDIDKVYVRTYAPLKEYGGWGLKGTKQHRAYNISGKEGLQLELKDGRKVLIGTQKPDEISAVLKMLNK
jgi:hypothetical protein